jgi:hypothetical protein
MSVSQQQYDNRTASEYAGFTPLSENERQLWSGTLTGLEGTYAADEEYGAFVRDEATVGLGANGRFVAIREPVMSGPEEELPSFITPQDVRSHGWFLFRMPVYGVMDFGKNLVAAPILQQMADSQDWGPNDPGTQRKHCWVNCVATGLSLGDSSSIAVMGTTQEVLTTVSFWQSPDQRALWADSKRDMEANRRGQNLFYNFYVGRCKEACISQTP